MTYPRRHHRSAFALIEVLVAVVFISVFVFALMQSFNQALLEFMESSDQHSGAWLAELKMAELVSQELPDPTDEERADSWILTGRGDFAYMDGRLNEINQLANEEWAERNYFADFTYEWSKELIFVGPEFIGTDEDLYNYEQPVDEYNQPLPNETDPRTELAARLVRVTLIVRLPDRNREAETYEEEQRLSDETTIKLVTYVDPSSLYSIREEAEEAEQPEENEQPEGQPQEGEE